MWTSKYSGSRVIVAKIADIGPPGAPQYFFSEKNLERSNYCTPRHMQGGIYGRAEAVEENSVCSGGGHLSARRQGATIHTATTLQPVRRCHHLLRAKANIAGSGFHSYYSPQDEELAHHALLIYRNPDLFDHPPTVHTANSTFKPTFTKY